MQANIYRSVTCGDLREEHIGQEVRLAGWVENIRDHGGVMFLDIRDEYGVTQVVVHDDSMLADVNRECTVTISGKVVKRDEDTINKKIATGMVEVVAETLTVLGKCKNNLPFEVVSSTATNEDTRLRYRFLDLRNPKVHNNILLRSQVISFLRPTAQGISARAISNSLKSAQTLSLSMEFRTSSYISNAPSSSPAS